jgi:acetyl-CoA acetyltransferase
MWQRSGLRPTDVDVAGLYDGFSFIPLIWLESLGFCEIGESGHFIEGGRQLTFGGRVPSNTNGGQLSGGRLHGYGFIHEAVLQLRGQASGRQVDGAEVAVVTNGVGPAAGCMALTRMQ